MASRLVVLRQRTTAAIEAALAVFPQQVAPFLAARIEPFLEEGESLDFNLLQRVLGRMITASRQKLIDADKAHIDELTDDVGPRLVRDDVVDAVRHKLIEIRQLAQGLFGLAHAIEIVAVDGSTALQPEFLWRQAEHTLSRLRSPDLKRPKASTAAITFDPLQLADELEPLVTALRQAIDGIEIDRREAAVSVEAKHGTMSDHDLLLGASGRIVTGLFLLAGRQDLANRIRVALPRRRRQQPQDGEETVPTVSEPATGATGTDAATT